jgi:hypothetical protein
VGLPITHEHRSEPPAAQAQRRQTRALRLAVEKVCAAGQMPAPLCAEAHALCDDVDAGLVSADDGADEIRALLGGTVLRAQGVGEPCCQIADVLLADLARPAGVVWVGRTVPGGEDRANGRTGVVELRFPAADFWAIPAIAHEMGHILATAPQLGGRQGSGNAARRVIDEGYPPAQREELFCDFYATYVLGSAFPALMILERLDPRLAAPERPFPDAAEAAATHPTPDKRVLVMLQTLAQLDEAAGPWNQPQAQARQFLRAAWHERLASAGETTTPHPATEKVLQHLVKRLWTEVDPILGCRFTTSMAARTLVDDLGAGRAVSSRAGVRVLDLVAAAWKARIINGSLDQAAISGLAARAQAAAEAIAQRAEDQTGGQL